MSLNVVGDPCQKCKNLGDAIRKSSYSTPVHGLAFLLGVVRVVRAFAFDWQRFGLNHTCYSPQNSRNLD